MRTTTVLLLIAAVMTVHAADLPPSGIVAYDMKIDRSIELNAQEKVSAASVIDDAQGILYTGAVTTAESAAQSEIVKIRLSDFQRIATLTVPGFGTPPSVAVIDVAHGFAYFVFGDASHTGPSSIVKIDLATFQVSGTLRLTAAESAISCGAVDAAHGFAYFGSYSSPEIIKINLATFQPAQFAALTAADGVPISVVLDTARGFAYFATHQPEQVLKVNLTTLAVVNRTHANGDDTMGRGAIIDPALGFAYFGTITTTPFGIEANLAALTLSDDLSGFQQYINLETSFGNKNINSILLDASHHIAFYGIEDDQENIREVRLTDYNTVGTLPLASGQETSMAGPHNGTFFMSHSLSNSDGLSRVLLTPSAPSITNLQPAKATAGDDPVNVTVAGANFVYGATATWNGQNRPTDYLSPSGVTMHLQKTDLQTPAEAAIVVINPDKQVSNAMAFKVWPRPTLPGTEVVASNDYSAGINTARTLARGNDGILHAVYSRQSAVFYAQSSDDGRTWKEETINDFYPISFPIQFQPAIAVDSKNTVHVVWIGNGIGDDPFAFNIAYRRKTAAGWQPQERLTNQPANSGQGVPAMAIDANDNVHVVWNGRGWGTNAGHYNLQYRERTAQGWEAQQGLTDLPADQTNQALAIGLNGSLHIAWTGGGIGTYPQNQNVHYMKCTAGICQPSELLTDAAADHEMAVIAVDSRDSPHIVWGGSSGGPAGGISYVEKMPSGWSTPFALGDGSNPSIALDHSDNVHVLWAGGGRGNNPSVSNLYHRIKSSASWQTLDLVTDAPEAQQEPNLLWSAQPILDGRQAGVPFSGYTVLWHSTAAGNATLRYFSTASWTMRTAGPTNVKAQPGDGQVTVSWDVMGGISTFRIYASTQPNVTPSNATIIQDVSNAQATGVMTGLQNGTLYYFAVSAWPDGFGVPSTESALSAELSARPNGTAQPPPNANPPATSIDLAQVTVRPSPWRSDLHAGRDIVFDHISTGSMVKIFTASGRWVATAHESGGKASWNVKADNGELVASGLYFYLITDGQGHTTRGKFGVIR